MDVLVLIAFLGFGFGLLAMLVVIVLRRDPHGRLVMAGLVIGIIGYVGLIGYIVASLLG